MIQDDTGLGLPRRKGSRALSRSSWKKSSCWILCLGSGATCQLLALLGWCWHLSGFLHPERQVTRSYSLLIPSFPTAVKRSASMDWESRQEMGGKGPRDGLGQVLGATTRREEKTERGCLCPPSFRASDLVGR